MAVTGSTITHIAVISVTADDFQSFFSQYEHLKGSKKRKILTENAIYHCITKPNDVCGLAVDTVMFTNYGIFNKNLEKIIEHIKPCIRSLWK